MALTCASLKSEMATGAFDAMRILAWRCAAALVMLAVAVPSMRAINVASSSSALSCGAYTCASVGPSGAVYCATGRTSGIESAFTRVCMPHPSASSFCRIELGERYGK